MLFLFKKHFTYHITPVSLIGLVLLLLTVMIGWLLPPELGAENSIIEWSQVLLLGLGALFALSTLFQTSLPLPRRKLYAWSAYVFLLAMGRELSWGRVFYMDNAGHIPLLKQLWFGPYIHPLIAAITIAALIYFVKTGLHQELVSWFKGCKLPLVDILLIVCGTLLADISEHHSSGLLGSQGEIFEELFETIVYWSLISFICNVIQFDKQKKFLS